MIETSYSNGLSLRKAALIAGIGLLIMAICAPYAEFYVFPKLLVAGDIEATRQNILEDQFLFLSGVMGHFITLTCDIIVAWALYVLLRPVNPSFSLLTAWFRLSYTVIAFVGLFNLFTVFSIITSTDYGSLVNPDQLDIQVFALLESYDHIRNAALIIFGMHLMLLGGLVLGASYIPRFFGVIVAMAGASYVVYYLAIYFAPEANLDWLFFVVLGELVFMLWLLIGGWWLKDPVPESPRRE